MKFTIADTFAGIGGFSLAFHMAGAQTAWSCEIDKKAKELYHLRFPEVVQYDDIRAIPDDAGAIDCLCGGFPCQDLSVAGRRAGLEGERSGLFYDLVSVIDRFKPQWFCLENVPGLLSSEQGRDMEVVLYSLEAIGYSVAWRVLDAQFFGVPQRRNRVFLVGHQGGWAGAAAVLFEPEGVCWDTPQGGEAGEDIAATITQRIGKGGFTDPVNDNIITTNTLKCCMVQPASGDFIGILSPSPYPDGVREATGLPGRVDRPHTPDSPRYRQLGNAVAVPVVY